MKDKLLELEKDEAARRIVNSMRGKKYYHLKFSERLKLRDTANNLNKKGSK